MRPVSRRWSSPPAALRTSQMRLENVVLIPASELASFATWQEQAQRIPSGATLLVVSDRHPHLQEVGRRICHGVRGQGRPITLTTIHHRT
jgi:hypothetical protein